MYYVNQLIPQGEGPVILRDKNLLTMGLADAFFVVGDTLFFCDSQPGTGVELWKSDGTEAGTVLVRDINPGPGSSNPVIVASVQ